MSSQNSMQVSSVNFDLEPMSGLVYFPSQRGVFHWEVSLVLIHTRPVV